MGSACCLFKVTKPNLRDPVARVGALFDWGYLITVIVGMVLVIFCIEWGNYRPVRKYRCMIGFSLVIWMQTNLY